MNQNYNQFNIQTSTNTQSVNKNNSFTKMYFIGVGIFIVALVLGVILGKILFGKDLSTSCNNTESTSSNENIDGPFLMDIDDFFHYNW